MTAGLRADLGLADDELFVLAPVRVVPRKGLEHAVELVARLGRPARFVISHASGDEGMEYEARIREFARLLDVDVLWAADRVVDVERGTMPTDGGSTRSATCTTPAIWSAYPSLIEGFGNAYLEAVYHRKPVFVNRYPVYDVDIRPKGFRNIEMNGFVTEAAVEERWPCSTIRCSSQPGQRPTTRPASVTSRTRSFAMAFAPSSRSCPPRSPEHPEAYACSLLGMT